MKIFFFVHFLSIQYKEFKDHKNPELPWIDWHYRPMITSDSTNANYYHYQLKRRTPCIPDVYFHDLPEDSSKTIWIMDENVQFRNKMYSKVWSKNYVCSIKFKMFDSQFFSIHLLITLDLSREYLIAKFITNFGYGD